MIKYRSNSKIQLNFRDKHKNCAAFYDRTIFLLFTYSIGCDYMLKNYNLSEGPPHTYVPLPRCLVVAAEGFGNICIQITVILGFEVEADACLVPGVAQIVAVGGGYTIVAQAGVSATAEVMQYRSFGVYITVVAKFAAKLEA